MPRYDGTGPRGYGPATGWGMGPCGCGLGWRRGWGGGFGGRRFYGMSPIDRQPSEQEEKEWLEEERKYLEEDLVDIKSRLGQFKEQKISKGGN